MESPAMSSPPPLDLSGWHNRTYPIEGCEAAGPFTAEEVCSLMQRRWLNWYISDYVYAQPTVIFICSFIAVFSLVHRGTILYASKRNAAPESQLLVKLLALCRFLAVKHVRIRNWSSVSLGNCLIIAGLGVFLLLMTFVPQPYYWPVVGMAGSPPIATRTGWMGLALLPFLLVLASKRNYIAYLTDTSHEKLQVFHRWVAMFMLVLGLIHAFAFLRYNNIADMVSMMWQMNYFYWTGVGMLVPQLWLTFMSLAPVRNRWYELFKMSHRVTAVVFVVFFFLHCADTLSSWVYTWALVGVYGSSVLFRIVTTLNNRRRQRYSPGASLECLAGGDLLVIRVPNTGLSWSAGQHFFFRFLGMNAFDSIQSHPFTVVSTPSGESSEVVAIAKVRRGAEGEVRHLSQIAHWQGGLHDVDVILDGPYGNRLVTLPTFEHILLLGGGSGLTFIVSVANELVKLHHRSDVKIVATCRTARQLQVYLDHLPTASDISAGLTKLQYPYELDAHVTYGEHTSSVEGLIDAADVPRGEKRANDNSSVPGRPALRDTIRQAATAAGSTRLAIVACGPPAFMTDVQNEAAAINLDILRGTTRLRELYLRSEAFYW